MTALQAAWSGLIADSRLRGFTFTAFVISWALWIPAGLQVRGALTSRLPVTLLVVLGSFGPMIAAMVVAARHGGREEVWNLFRRLRLGGQLRPGEARVWCPDMSVFEGVGVALVTIFDRDLSVDVDATAGLAEQLVDAGVGAVLVAGSTGEAAALEPEERTALIGAVRQVLPVAVPVIAGTGAPSAHQAATLTAQVAEAGADAALVLSPPRTADPRPYYATVAGAAPDLALLAYHFPAVSGPGIAIDYLADLPVVGLKDSTGDPGRLLEELTTYDGDVYVGNSALLTQAGAIGATGAILALANSRPEDCVAAFGGDAAAQLALAPHHRALAPFPAGIKAQVADRWGVSAAARMG